MRKDFANLFRSLNKMANIAELPESLKEKIEDLKEGLVENEEFFIDKKCDFLETREEMSQDISVKPFNGIQGLLNKDIKIGIQYHFLIIMKFIILM